MAKLSWAGFFAQHHHPVLEQLFDSHSRDGFADQLLRGRFARHSAMQSPPAASESLLGPPAEALSIAGPAHQALPADALTHELTVSLALSSPDSPGTAGDYLVSILDSSEINFVLDVENQRLVPPSEWPSLVEQMADLLGPSQETLSDAISAPGAALADASAILSLTVSAPDLPLDLTPVTIPGH